MVAMSLVLAPLLLRGLKLAAKTPYAMRRWREKLAQAGVDESLQVIAWAPLVWRQGRLALNTLRVTK